MCLRLTLGEFASWKNHAGDMAATRTQTGNQAKIEFPITMIGVSALRVVNNWATPVVKTFQDDLAIMDTLLQHASNIYTKQGSSTSAETSTITGQFVRLIPLDLGKAACLADGVKAQEVRNSFTSGNNDGSEMQWASTPECTDDTQYYRVHTVLEYCIPRQNLAYMPSWTPTAGTNSTDRTSIKRTASVDLPFIPLVVYDADEDRFTENCLGIGLADTVQMANEGIYDEMRTILTHNDQNPAYVQNMCYQLSIWSAAVADSGDVSALAQCSTQVMLGTHAYRNPVPPYVVMKDLPYVTAQPPQEYSCDVRKPFDSYFSPPVQPWTATDQTLSKQLGMTFTFPSSLKQVAERTVRFADSTVAFSYSFSHSLAKDPTSGVLHLQPTNVESMHVKAADERTTVAITLTEESQTCHSRKQCNGNAVSRTCEGNSECSGAGRMHDSLYCFGIQDATMRMTKKKCSVEPSATAETTVPSCNFVSHTTHSPFFHQPNWHAARNVRCKAGSPTVEQLLGSTQMSKGQMSNNIEILVACLQTEPTFFADWNSLSPDMVRSNPIVTVVHLMQNHVSNPVLAELNGGVFGGKESSCKENLNCNVGILPFDRNERIKAFCSHNIDTQRMKSNEGDAAPTVRTDNTAIDVLQNINAALLTKHGGIVHFFVTVDIYYKSDLAASASNQRRLLQVSTTGTEVFPMDVHASDASPNTARRLQTTDAATAVTTTAQGAFEQKVAILGTDIVTGEPVEVVVNAENPSQPHVTAEKVTDVMVPGKCWAKYPDLVAGKCDHWSDGYKNAGIVRVVLMGILLVIHAATLMLERCNSSS